jgi:hypothetical protein
MAGQTAECFFGKIACAKKKDVLDFSSVPAHNDERNCTKADQCNEYTEAG